ncbi:GntR family transcriptional regulator [Ahrensia kielensis]|uniref:GntR family transcriptional regulator n=1 Tax=Ahrensia kielensis TaxID=76980 RepID=A0ABU9T2N3_9HYPH
MLSQELRSLILSGVYTAGMQLRQGEIARSFGVSHIPIREALQTLKHEGLIEQITNRGAFVAAIGLGDLQNIWDMRRVLEPMAAVQAIAHTTEIGLRRVEKIIDMADQETSNLELVRLNWEFHLALYEPCGNDLLLEFIRALYRKADRYSCMLWANHDYGHQASQEHRRILEFYRQRDVEQVKINILEHINEVERLVRIPFEG